MEAEDTLNERYRKAIVSYIDILGFKSKVRECGAHQIANLLHLFKEVAGKHHNSQTYTMNAICFSDLIVRVVEPKNRIYVDAFKTMLFNELEALAQAQWAAMNMLLSIRGGVCCGDIYILENTVFGPALIDAHEIESKQAKAPMIMVAKELCESLLPAERENLIQQSPKGKFFIDYLGFIKSNEENQFPYELEMHRSITQTILSRWEEKAENRERIECFRSWWKWYEELHSTQ